jgi:hypothetical protein
LPCRFFGLFQHDHVTGLFQHDQARLRQLTGDVLATLDRNDAIFSSVQYERWNVRKGIQVLDASPNLMAMIGLSDAHVVAVAVGSNGVLEGNMILVHGHLQKGRGELTLETLQEYHWKFHDGMPSIG